MLKTIKVLFFLSISSCLIAILAIFLTYFSLKPNLPEISLVDQSQLQMPLKVYTEDGVLIGEFGEIKRRPLDFQDIPIDIKNAFLAAEDDGFFNHQGISYTGLFRSVIRCLSPRGCFGGGGTISMQVVRGYLLTRDQTITRKIKEIFLALQLESELSKEQIFELYVNRNFFGNRSYGVEAAANTYFNKSTLDLNLAESATIAAMAQSPSRINAIKAPLRTKQRRDWILSRMLKLRLITFKEFSEARSEPLKVSKNINLYDIEARHLAELARQDIIKRYGLQAYKKGWSIYTTLNSKAQESAQKSVIAQLSAYHKRHGWMEADNFLETFNEDQLNSLKASNTDFLFEISDDKDSSNDDNLITNKISSIFDQYAFYKSFIKGIVINVEDKEAYILNDNLEIEMVKWTSEYEWARKKISINQRGSIPKSFKDFLKVGDFVYLKKEDGFFILDQMPEAESSLISINPKSGAVKAYVAGTNFDKSNFDRIKLSYPQSGSSFKPFIYATALANGYNLSSLINDAPIAFEDKNLESIWKPQNYTGEFYGPTSLREALIKSINIVSIKLLRELGIAKSHNYINNFGFEKSRLPSDLSLALGSGNFSPVEMVRGFSVIANGGYLVDPYYVTKIEDRDGNLIYSHDDFIEFEKDKNLTAFPWLNTLEMNVKRPYFLTKPKSIKNKVIDERVAYLVKDILEEFMKKGTAGRKSAFLDRDDIAGKTGTTNDAISTWFSGFHEDLATTVWVGTDNFSSLGENEYGSTIALPIWLDYMSNQLIDLEIKQKSIPENISFVRVSGETGKIENSQNADTYFELFLDENTIN